MDVSRRRFIQLALIMLLVIGVAVGGYFLFRRTLIANIRETVMNIDTNDQIAHGEILFQTRVCTSCHTLQIAGSVGDEGPDLTGIGARESVEYLQESIANPNAVIVENCPEGLCATGVMPEFGNLLTDKQIDALVAYLASQ